MICKGNFLDTYFKSLQKKLTWCQTFLREKRRNGISAEARSPGGCCCCSLPAGHRCPGSRGARQPLSLIALLSPRTTWLLLPFSQAAKHRFCAPWQPFLPALGAWSLLWWGLIIPRWATPKAQGPSICPISVTLWLILGWGWWRGRFLSGCCTFWEMPAEAAPRCCMPQVGFPPTSDCGVSGTCTSSPLQKLWLMPHVPLGPHCWGEAWWNLLKPLEVTVTQGSWHI